MTLHFIIFFICAYTEKIAYGNKKILLSVSFHVVFLLSELAACEKIYYYIQRSIRKYRIQYIKVVIDVSYYLSKTTQARKIYGTASMNIHGCSTNVFGYKQLS